MTLEAVVEHMNAIKTFNFTPISNDRQRIHTVSFSERIRKGKETVLKPHRTNFYILLFVTQGHSKHLVDFNVLDIAKGDFIIIRPGQVHAFFSSNSTEGTIIAFTEDFMLHKSQYHFLSENARILNELSFGNFFHIAEAKNEKIFSLIHLIQQELSSPYDELQESLLQNYVSSLLLSLLRIKRGDQYHSPEKSKELLYALQFKSLVEKSCVKQSTVSYYAQELGIGIRSLQKIAELYFGKSPKAIIQECILLESKRMLIDPSVQIKEIAYQLGFNEPTNFSKFFKKFTKISRSSSENRFTRKSNKEPITVRIAFSPVTVRF